MKVSSAFLAAALVSVVALSVAAALFVTGDRELEKLGFVAGVVGLVVPSIAAALKASQAADQTNGNLDARVEAAVGRVVGNRRAGDRVVVHETRRPDGVELIPARDEPELPPADPGLAG